MLLPKPPREGRWCCKPQEVSTRPALSPELRLRPRGRRWLRSTHRLWTRSSAVFVFLQGQGRWLGCPHCSAVMTQGSEKGLSSGVQCPEKDRASFLSAGEGMWGRGRAECPPPLHPWPWLLGPVLGRAGALQRGPAVDIWAM